MVRSAAGGPTDEELVKRCLAHDEEAWEILLDRYAGYIYAIAAHGFRLSPEQAEEVLQETALSMVQHLEAYRGTGPLRAWIGAVAANAARQYLRRQKPPAVLPPEMDVADVTQELLMAQAEEADAVHAALERLPPECRDVLTQAFYEERRYVDIAAALGIPEGTVASRIARCLARLRPLLEQDL